MSSSHLFRRFATVSTAALLATMLLGTGTAVAKTPGWQFIDAFTHVPVTDPTTKNCTTCAPFTSSPTTVGPNQLAAYHVTIKNTGSSNISALYLSTDIPASNSAGNPVAFVDNTGENNGACRHDSTLPLYCSFGALNAGTTVTVEVVFQAPASSLSFNFKADGNGNTPSDGGTSHGDSLLGPTAFTVSTSTNFAGGFQLNGGDVSNNQTVGKNNIQGSSVHQTGSLLPVTIQDGFTSTPPLSDPNPCGTLTCIGDWTVVQVGTGTQGPIEVKLLIYGKSIKGTIDLSKISLWHDGDTQSPISLRCDGLTTLDAVSTGPECIKVSFTGNNNGNVLIDAFLDHNGTLRGLNG